MNATLTEIIGLGSLIVTAAVITYAIAHGKETAKIVTAFGDTFVTSVKAVNHPG